MDKKKILLFTYTDVNYDPIVIHQIDWLKDKYDVSLVGLTPGKTADLKFYKYPSSGFVARNINSLLLALGLYVRYTWNKGHRKLVNELSGVKYDIIIVHHIKLIPVALKISPSSKVILFAHEYYTHMYDDSLWWRLLFQKYFLWLSKKYIPLCAATITVNESIKDLYEADYGIKADYIHNTTKYHALAPTKVDPKEIKIIHHGLASSSRRLELMIELMKYLDDRFTLTLILQSNSIVNEHYIKKLKKLASGNPRIKYASLVPYDEIAAMGNKYDIGLFFMPPTTLNEKFSLGHKVSQYIQSRLMLVVSPLPEMKKLVEKYNLGFCSEDYDAEKLARKLNALSADEIMYYKNQSHIHAEDLGSEPWRIKFLNIIEKILKPDAEEKKEP